MLASSSKTATCYLENTLVSNGAGSALPRPKIAFFYSYQKKARHSKWPKVGSWCEKNGSLPCCSDMYNGTCMIRNKINYECPRYAEMCRMVLIVDAATEMGTYDINCFPLTGSVAVLQRTVAWVLSLRSTANYAGLATCFSALRRFHVSQNEAFLRP